MSEATLETTPQAQVPIDGLSPLDALKAMAAAKGLQFNDDLSVTPKASPAAEPKTEAEAPAQPAETPGAAEAQPASQPQPQDQQAAGTTPEPVQVPEKFQTKDGKLDGEKVNKSLLNAEEALKKYEKVERELRQKQAEVNKARMGLANVPTQAPAQTPGAPESFDKQLEADVQKFGLGVVMARLFEAAQQTAVDRIANQIEEVKTETSRNRQRAELESIAKFDTSVLSDEGIAELSRIRAENPHLENAPSPWMAAYDVLLANRVKQERLSGQVKPSPKAPTAPPVPVGAAQRVMPAKTVKDPMQAGSKAEMAALLAEMSDADAAAYFAKHLAGHGVVRPYV